MSKKQPEPTQPIRTSALERYLAIGIVVIVAASIVCFFSVIIATWAGAANDDSFSHGIWPAVFGVQYYGLPVAFIMLVILLVSSSVRRSRAARSEQ
ncbi:MAG: multidrug ABC transporter ATPase [Cryobacterium sp.]|nr:multidrug ABC transporter ATPase [Cryobacterium sp.]MBX3089419.1 multidrug ABC transporter ATPase [Cryobacterium sp.]MBX3116786.1 multidrug ABC transporter ATPase [Cryobacterium sp.]MCC7128489.1 multidrug ABC transporter ATPase [Microbacteriaceae bacterium]MCO5294683.1 multidrug ABC transporter ATPase [Homoserinimonas sp.]